MRVAIAYPPLAGKGSPMLTQNRQFQWMHQGSYLFPVIPATAATALDRAGFDVGWLDGITKGWNRERFWKETEAFGPELIALETKTPVVKLHWDWIRDLKARLPGCRVALMGDHATAMPAEQFERSPVDYVISRASYDVTLLGLARHLRDGSELPGGIWFRDGDQLRDTGPADLRFSLDDAPFIDRDLTDADAYFEKWAKRRPFYYTMAGRDCPRPLCTFCSWTTTNPRFQVRSTDNLLDELEILHGDRGVPEVFDDTGTFPPGRWRRRFCAGMEERGLAGSLLFSSNERVDYVQDPAVTQAMARAGWRKVKVGLESASDETLKRLDKGITVAQVRRGLANLKDAGIGVHLTIMVGYWWESRDDAKRTIDLAGELMSRGMAEMLQCTVVMPYPGTPLYRQGVEAGVLRFAPDEYDRFDMTEPAFRTDDMSPDEVMAMCRGVYRSFLHPRYIARRLAAIRNFEELWLALRGARAVAGHLRDFLPGRGGAAAA